jgi:hypothetical protein
LRFIGRVLRLYVMMSFSSGFLFISNQFRKLFWPFRIELYVWVTCVSLIYPTCRFQVPVLIDIVLSWFEKKNHILDTISPLTTNIMTHYHKKLNQCQTILVLDSQRYASFLSFICQHDLIAPTNIETSYCLSIYYNITRNGMSRKQSLAFP